MHLPVRLEIAPPNQYMSTLWDLHFDTLGIYTFGGLGSRAPNFGSGNSLTHPTEDLATSGVYTLRSTL